ncbi:class F sortase [Streptomyces boninensis]|uniref:class F sortase n=1 Tax=Streptomyces boninensis TaxID=2039455 RepID=UPI003B225DB0
MVTDSSQSAPPAPPRPSAHEALPAFATPAPADVLRPPTPTVRPLAHSAPKRIIIPAISVNAPLMALGQRAPGALATPPGDKPNLAGWYRDGITPGSKGTALITGHLDTGKGPAVFYSLGSLHKGNTVRITRADGRTAVFTVHAVEQHDRKDFPAKRVYGQAKRPELRLITCGGSYSKTSGYSANTIAYAHLTKVITPGSAPHTPAPLLRSTPRPPTPGGGHVPAQRASSMGK